MRFGATALRGIVSLLLFILILLLIFRSFAAWREGGANPPKVLTYFSTATGSVAELAASAMITNPAALEPLLRSMIVRKEGFRRALDEALATLSGEKR